MGEEQILLEQTISSCFWAHMVVKAVVSVLSFYSNNSSSNAAKVKILQLNVAIKDGNSRQVAKVVIH